MIELNRQGKTEQSNKRLEPEGIFPANRDYAIFCTRVSVFRTDQRFSQIR
jgi:hypothetical protein